MELQNTDTLQTSNSDVSSEFSQPFPNSQLKLSQLSKKTKLIFNVLIIIILVVVAIYAINSKKHSQTKSSSVYVVSSPTPTILDQFEDKDSIKQIANSYNAFGFMLLQKLQSLTPKNTIAISSTSISQAVGMTYLGAAGDTKMAIEKSLNITNLSLDNFIEANKLHANSSKNPQSGVTINTANALWENKDIELNKSFVENVKNSFNAETQKVDYTNRENAVNQINNWVSKKTNNKISKIIQNLPLNTINVITNAVYFKGLWTVPFDSKLTKNSIFTTGDGENIQIPMMTQEREYQYLETPSFQLIRLTYGSLKLHSYSMYVLLPKQNLSSFLDQLTNSNWNDWIGNLGDNIQVGTLNLPKFKISYNTSLKNALSSSGMSIVFTKKADFSQMISNPKFAPYYISDVIHAAAIEVTEEGTEAAAATAVIPVAGGGGESAPLFTMNVNKPFFFAITNDESGEIYFMGIVNNPI